MNPRNLIQVLLSFKASNWKASQEKLDLLTLGYKADLIEAASNLKPKAKKKGPEWAEKVLPPEVQDEILQKFNAKRGPIIDSCLNTNSRIQKLIPRLCQRTSPTPGDLELQLDNISVGDYHTQGFGAERYARAAAEQLMDKALSFGVKARVERVVRPSTVIKSGLVSFQVTAMVSDSIDVEIIKNKQESLRDWLKNCWKRGVNPRVYNPWLPPGLEDKMGLDYFGNEKAC